MVRLKLIVDSPHFGLIANYGVLHWERVNELVITKKVSVMAK